MTINFPNSPQNNDTYTLGNRTWKYNGYSWELVPLTGGYTGSQGVTGFTGSAGTNGFTGSQGDIGYTGSASTVIGYTGSQGDIGYTGSASTVAGFTGSQGIQGDIGYTGSQGDIGYTGSASTVAGFTGSQGATGFTGSSASNITVSDFDTGVVDTDLSSVSASDDTLASAKAIKTYVDDQVASAGGGGTSWQAVKTAAFNATAGEGYFVNTTSAAITATLPASPTLGDEIAFIDYARTFDTNNLTVARNGNPIQGSATDLTVSIEGSGFTLVFVDGTQGWLLKDK